MPNLKIANLVMRRWFFVNFKKDLFKTGLKSSISEAFKRDFTKFD